MTNHFFCLSRAVMGLIFVLTITLSACGSTDEDASGDNNNGDETTDETDDTEDADDSSDDNANDDSDESADLVIGTYTKTLSNIDKFQFKIFRSDGQYCSGSVDTDDAEADQDIDGTWTSEFFDDESGDGQEISISAGGVTYILSGSGLTLYQDSLGSDTFWTKDTSPTTSCDGETVD